MRLMRLWMVSGLAMGCGKVAALNPIHEGGYALWTRGISQADFRVEGGAIFSSGSGTLQIPLGLSLRPSRSWEFGLGLKTAWGDGVDPVSHIPVGIKYQLRGATVFNLDFLVAAGGSNHGLRLGLTTRTGRGRFSSRLSGQLGFLDALVDDGALLALEGGWTPAFRLGRSLLLESGFVASSQTRAFDDHFALDWQPGLYVPVWRDGGILTRITVGLAGRRREDLGVKVALARGF